MPGKFAGWVLCRRRFRHLGGLHVVPPREYAGHAIVIAIDNLDRPALAILRCLDAQPAGFLLLFCRHPPPLMAPEARAKFALERLPGVVVNEVTAPAIFDQKAGRIPRVKGSHVIAGMAPKRHTDAVGIAEREIIALPDIVEAVELDHHVMDHVGAALDKGDAVVAGIDVQEISREWPQPVVAELEAKDIRIKRHHLGDAIELNNQVTNAGGPGTEAGNDATRFERLACS